MAASGQDSRGHNAAGHQQGNAQHDPQDNPGPRRAHHSAHVAALLSRGQEPVTRLAYHQRSAQGHMSLVRRPWTPIPGRSSAGELTGHQGDPLPERDQLAAGRRCNGLPQVGARDQSSDDAHGDRDSDDDKDMCTPRQRPRATACTRPRNSGGLSVSRRAVPRAGPGPPSSARWRAFGLHVLALRRSETSPRVASGKGVLAGNDGSCATARFSWLRMETLPDWSNPWTKQCAATSTPSPPSIAPCSIGSTSWSLPLTPAQPWRSRTRCPPTRSATAVSMSARGNTVYRSTGGSRAAMPASPPLTLSS